MVGHVMMVLGSMHVAALLDTKAINVISVRLCFKIVGIGECIAPFTLKLNVLKQVFRNSKD